MLQVSLGVFLIREVDPVPMAFPSKLGMKVGKEFETEVDLFNRASDTITLYTPLLQADGMTARFSNVQGLRLAPQTSTKLQAFITAKTAGYLRGKVIIPSSSRYSPLITVDLICMANASQAEHHAEISH